MKALRQGGGLLLAAWGLSFVLAVGLALSLC